MRAIILAVLLFGPSVPFYEQLDLEQLTKFANDGVAEAQYELGRRYDKKVGVLENDSLAGEWYWKAAQQDYTWAQLALADLVSSHWRSLTVEDSNSQRAVFAPFEWNAESLYYKAAQTGLPEAEYSLALHWSFGLGGQYGNGNDSKRYLLSAAEKGYWPAQIDLAPYYRGITRSDKPDLAMEDAWIYLAFENGCTWYPSLKASLFSKLSDSDFVRAAVFLGDSFRNGKRVAGDLCLAEYWYRRAAEFNYAPAELKLARMFNEKFENGLYWGPCDSGHSFARHDRSAAEKETAKWYRRAANHGGADEKLAAVINYVFFPTDSEKFEWLTFAAEAGLVRAQFGLSQMYFDTGDIMNALKWAMIPAGLEDELAEQQVGMLTNFATNDQIREAHKLAEQWLEDFKTRHISDSTEQTKEQIGE